MHINSMRFPQAEVCSRTRRPSAQTDLERREMLKRPSRRRAPVDYPDPPYPGPASDGSMSAPGKCGSSASVGPQTNSESDQDSTILIVIRRTRDQLPHPAVQVTIVT